METVFSGQNLESRTEIKTQIQLFYILIILKIKAKNMSFNLVQFL
jgi:hypothetical protein